MAPTPMTLRDLRGHFSCLCPFYLPYLWKCSITMSFTHELENIRGLQFQLSYETVAALDLKLRLSQYWH